MPSLFSEVPEQTALPTGIHLEDQAEGTESQPTLSIS